MQRVILVTALGLLLAGPARADNRGERERPQRGADFREKMIERFDQDGDGRLSGEEREAARRQFARARGHKENRQADGKRDRRGPQGDQQGKARKGKQDRRGGPPQASHRGPTGGPPRPEEVFARLDRNDDGQLSKREFMAGARHMQEMHRQRGKRARGRHDRPADGPRFDEPGPRRGEGPRQGRGRGGPGGGRPPVDGD